MSSNELAERLIAQAWVRFGATGQASLGIFDPAKIGFRSACGFKTGRIVTTDNIQTLPLFLLELEQPQTRRETIVQVSPIWTSDDAGRYTYPIVDGLTRMQPFHFDWVGPDFTNPLWLPFDNSSLPAAPFDLNVYNGIALSLEAPGDIMISIFRAPRAEEGDSVPDLVTQIPAGVIP